MEARGTLDMHISSFLETAYDYNFKLKVNMLAENTVFLGPV